jgi:CheY-like chemotaxis protein
MAKVLIVDDNPDNRLLLSTLVEHAGHTAVEAATGHAGLASAKTEPADVVIVDLSLPDIPGAEVIRLLRADPLTANVTIALYTATQLAPAIEELVELYGIRAIVPKPADVREVLAVLEELTRAAG